MNTQGPGLGAFHAEGVRRAALIAVLTALALATAARPGEGQTAPDGDGKSTQGPLAGKHDQALKLIPGKDWPKAEATFREILAADPDSRDARWGLGIALAQTGRPDEAKTELDRAIGANPGVDELVLCGRIVEGERGKGSALGSAFAAEYRRRALESAMAQRYHDTNDEGKLVTVATLALDLDRQDEFDRAVAALEKYHPGRPWTHYLLSIRYGRLGRWLAAEDEVDKAVRLGMPAEQAETFLKETGLRERAAPWRYARYAGLSGAAVVAGLVVLLVGGKVLSLLTLHSAERGDPNAPVTGQQAALRKVYRLVINLAGLYYYVCLPFVMLSAVVLVLGLSYAVLSLPRIPVKLLVIVFAFGCAMLMTVAASVKSLFARLKAEDPGRKLTSEEAPALWELTREVAGFVGTRPVDEIWLAWGTELAVFERGSRWERLKDRGRRALILGVGVLDGFKVNDFRAVLAHEYGHFLHRDTAGGDVALRVNATMVRFVNAMAAQGNLQWWNIGWQFVRLYHYIFRRITHGASRLQEINADRVAARLCGKSAFENGLRHVIRRDILDGYETARAAHALEVSAFAPASRSEVERGWTVYDRAEARRQVDQQFDQIWQRGTTDEDTHPSPVERVRLLARLSTPSKYNEDGEGVRYVEDLFADPATVRGERAARVNSAVQAYVDRKREALSNGVTQIDAYLREHPGLTGPLVERGQILLELGEFDRAGADFSEAIRLDGPNPALAYYGRGRARVEEGNYDGAVADFARALDLDPGLGNQGRCQLGDALLKAGLGAEAAAEYTRAIEWAPGQIGLFLRRGDAHALNGDLDGAEADYARALELDPRCAEALAGRALVRSALGRRDEAESDATPALALEPAIADDYAPLAGVIGSDPGRQGDETAG